MPSLDQQAQRARRIINNGFRQHPVEGDIIVLRGIYRGWSTLTTSRYVGCGTTSVGRVRNRFHKNLSEIFRNPVLSGILRSGKVVWRCEVCGLPLPGMSERKARIHVARHFVPEMVIQLNGVMPKPDWWRRQ